MYLSYAFGLFKRSIPLDRISYLIARASSECALWVAYRPKQEHQNIDCCVDKVTHLDNLRIVWVEKCLFTLTV